MKKIYVVLIVLIILALARLVFVSNNQNITGNSAIVAPPEVPGSTFNCAAEISKLFNQKDQSLSKYQVKSKEITYQNQKYKTVVYKCPDEKYSYQNVFLLIKEEKTLFSMTTERFDDISIRDINKDKNPELVINYWNGGNCWDCVRQSVFGIVNNTVKDLFPDMADPERGEYGNVWLSDVNNDGIEDVLLNNTSWELKDGFFRSNAPSHITILTWEDGEYKVGGEMFSKYYLNKISNRNKELDKLLKNKDVRLNDVVGLAIENFWDYQEIEMNDKAYANFILQTDINTLPKTTIINDSDKIWLQGIRDEIEKEYKESRPTIMMFY